MKKYVFTSIMLLAVVLLCVTLLPVKAQAATSGDYIYEVVDGNATITGYTGEGGDLVIPSELDGYPVTVIGDSAFRDADMTSLTIPDSVITIEAFAFYHCTSMTTLSLGNGVKTVGTKAFVQASRLTSIDFGTSLESIGDEAFTYLTSLEEVNIPDNVISIGGKAFFYSSGLKRIYIGSGVAQIGEQAFGDNYKLEKIEVSEENAYFSSQNGVLFDKEKTILYRAPMAMQGEYVVPESVLLIWNYAFYKCEYLRSIVMQDGVVGIGDWAIRSCRKLEYVRVPSTVMVVGNGAFLYSDNLQYSTYQAGKYLGNEENPYHLFVKIREENAEVCLIRYGTVVIAGTAFSNAHKLVYLEIPETVLVIGASLFPVYSELEAVFYTGTLEQLEQLVVGEDNNPLYEVPIYYNAPLTVMAGDIDMDWEVNNDDIITLMWHVLFPEDNPIYGSGDLNQDGSVDNNDVIDLMWYILFPEDNPLPTGEKKSQDTGGITYLRKCNIAPLSLPA